MITIELLTSNTRWNPQHPKAAPQFRCHDCHKWISKTGPVALLFKDDFDKEVVILHLGCSDKPSSNQAHARWYPECPESWHDMYDHARNWGSRAGIAALLGIWPDWR
jgi:hypothetical protein